VNNSNKEKSNFCIYPFIGVSSKPNGDITPCCKNSTVLGNIKETSLEDIWNSINFDKQNYQKFIEYNNTLDNIRNTSIINIDNRFKDYK